MKNVRLLILSTVLLALFTMYVSYAKASVEPRPTASHTVVTPSQCDAVPKYWCAFVQYIAQTGSIVVDIRAYKGARDYGDTEKWRLLYYQDYIWNSSCSCYTFDEGYGPSAWATNTNLPASYSAYGQNNTLNASAALVRAKFEYKRTIYNGGWYWYSPDLYFFLNSH